MQQTYCTKVGIRGIKKMSRHSEFRVYMCLDPVLLEVNAPNADGT